MVANKIRQWLIFFRMHTGGLEAPIAGLGAAAAVGTLFDPRVALWAFVGLLYHAAGYGQNSYYDWENGFDKDDPHKQHHPLNTGAIKPSKAKNAANAAVVIYFLFTLFLVRTKLVPVLVVIAAFVCGLTYNLVGKKIKHKHIFLSAAHSSLFLIPYTYYASLDLFSLAIFFALVVHHIFQIAISGDIKDIMQDESSILSDIGIEGRKHIWEAGTKKNIATVYTKKKGRDIVGLISLTQIALVAIALQFKLDSLVVFSLIPFLLALLYLGDKIVEEGRYQRQTRLQYISIREVVGFWAIYLAIVPIIGIQAYILAFILCVAYVIIHSKFMWGTLLRPKV